MKVDFMPKYQSELEKHVLTALDNKGFRFNSNIERDLFLAEKATAVTHEGTTTLFVDNTPICFYSISTPEFLQTDANKISVSMNLEFQGL